MFTPAKFTILFISFLCCKAEECQNLSEICKNESAINCADPAARRFCPQTCGLCSTTTPPTTVPTSSVVTTTEACIDNYPEVCADYVKNNCTSPLASLACALSCGFCATPEPECLDRWTNCTVLVAEGACQNETHVAYRYCYMTCTNCTVPVTQSPKSAAQLGLWPTTTCFFLFTTAKLFF